MINRLNKYYRFLYKKALWQMPGDKKIVYLTFDDGPHPMATPFVLDILKKYNLKASFFCIGKNIVQYPELFNRIIKEGHALGNHTYNHLNGLKVSNDQYFSDYEKCQKLYPFTYFRPPYGRMSLRQMQYLSGKTKIVMWSILTKDYAQNISPEYALQTIQKNIKPGSIIVYHDSEKAFNNLSFSLERSIKFLLNNQYEFKALPV
jgi:peptidoglycan/xylan/chitin deacetylase (PgdA/CDA1 family)